MVVCINYSLDGFCGDFPELLSYLSCCLQALGCVHNNYTGRAFQQDGIGNGIVHSNINPVCNLKRAILVKLLYASRILYILILSYHSLQERILMLVKQPKYIKQYYHTSRYQLTLAHVVHHRMLLAV